MDSRAEAVSIATGALAVVLCRGCGAMTRPPLFGDAANNRTSRQAELACTGEPYRDSPASSTPRMGIPTGNLPGYPPDARTTQVDAPGAQVEELLGDQRNLEEKRIHDQVLDRDQDGSRREGHRAEEGERDHRVCGALFPQHERHEECGAYCEQEDSVTAVRYPDGIDDGFRKLLASEHGIHVAGGQDARPAGPG